MPTITFISHAGVRREVYAETGNSLMEAAMYHSVPGVIAECGGACSCATCHVYIEADWYDRLPAPDEQELALLEFAVEASGNSRLSCQIEVSEELDGLIVHTPESQY